jgi:predicted RND superfamily exporter protein
MIKKAILRNCELIFGHPGLYLLILLVLTSIAGLLYSRLPVETSVESLIIENDPDLLFHEKFKKQFGEDEVLVAAFSCPDIFSQDVLRFIERQTADLEALEEVRDVVSLTNVEDILGSDNYFTIKPLVEEIPEDVLSLSTVRDRALSNRLIEGNIVSKDGISALFLIRTFSHTDDETYDARLIKKVSQVLEKKPMELSHLDFHLAGWLVTDVSMSRFMNGDMAKFMPLTYLFLFILTWFFLRNAAAVFISIVNVTLCLLWTMAILYLVRGAMSPMTAILPPLIMALSVSDSIHVFVEFLKKDRAQGDLLRSMRETMGDLALPCFLTSLTTAIGFLSLGVSDIPPIRHFGLAAAGGMMAEFCLSMSVLPLGVLFLRNFRGMHDGLPFFRESPVHGLVEKIRAWVPGHRNLVTVISLVLVGLAMEGITRLNVETNLLEYFRQDTRVRRDAEFVDRRLGGVNTMEISFKARGPDAFLEPKNLAVIEKVAAYLEEQPVVSQTMSVNVFLKQMNKAFHGEDETFYALPTSREMTAQYLLLYDGDEIGNFIDEDYQWARLSARVTEHSSRNLAAYFSRLEDFLTKITAESGLEARITGKTFLVNKLIKSIVDSQILSLSLAFLVIFAILFLVFRSIGIGFISVICNSLPIIFNLGLMGWLGIPLNTATAIISAVAIGVAVDDTIHLLHQYQENRGLGIGHREAILGAIDRKGSPIITTSLVLMGGFGILVFSSFVPTVQFGFLCSLIMFFALVSDLVVLPALMLLGQQEVQR